MRKQSMILNRHPDVSNSDLKAIGYWKSNSQPDLPDPRDFVGEWDSALERLIVIDYVKNASPIHYWKGWSECRFKCRSTGKGLWDKKACLDLGSRCLSDGTYVWPEGFHHYLDAHNVIPPREFIDHVLSKSK